MRHVFYGECYLKLQITRRSSHHIFNIQHIVFLYYHFGLKHEILELRKEIKKRKENWRKTQTTPCAWITWIEKIQKNIYIYMTWRNFVNTLQQKYVSSAWIHFSDFFFKLIIHNFIDTYRRSITFFSYLFAPSHIILMAFI